MRTAFDEIRNWYWHVRQLRPDQGAKRRRLYRRIHAQKKRLLVAGVDREELRLWCRSHTKTCPEAAKMRFLTHQQDRQAMGLSLTINQP